MTKPCHAQIPSFVFYHGSLDIVFFYSFFLSHFGLPVILILVGEVLEYSGMCKKLLFSTIEFKMWAVNCFTCFWIYLRKASKRQRPINCILYVGIWGCVWYIAMAPPAQIECVPTSDALKPKGCAPISLVADLKDCIALLSDMCKSL